MTSLHAQSFNLYNTTLKQATSCTAVAKGNFSGLKDEETQRSVTEIVVANTSTLTLQRFDDNQLKNISRTEAFGLIRAISALRLHGSNRDYLVVTSDSGRIVVLQFDPEKNDFIKIHQETYGKTGVRRLVPGQFIACNPKGLAVMVAAVEKQKMVYMMNRDAASRLTISSPLEGHKSNMLVFDCVALDNDFYNPKFCCLELDYSEADQDPSGEAAAEASKRLTIYEVDLGLNHVVRKWSEETDDGASKLIPVPLGENGPGGVIVCCENWLIYKKEGHPDIRTLLPRRVNLAHERGLLITCSVTFGRKNFFTIVQSELGDLYMVTLETSGETVTDLVVSYFDTIPPAAAMVITREKVLVAYSEFGDHTVYTFEEPEEDNPNAPPEVKVHGIVADDGAEVEITEFKPRSLYNLAKVENMSSLCPLTKLKCGFFAKEERPQLMALCGGGINSSLRSLRCGLAVEEMAVSEMPANPSAVWTIKERLSEEHDTHMVVSFLNATLVFKISSAVEECHDTSLLLDRQTLGVAGMRDDSWIQIHKTGIRHINAHTQSVRDWVAPAKSKIVKCAWNQTQVVIALNKGEIRYFELDDAGLVSEVHSKIFSEEIACLSLPAVREDRRRSLFMSVGLWDDTVRVLSLDPSAPLEEKALQSFPSAPESLAFMLEENQLVLNIGLNSGMMSRSNVDKITGRLSNTRTRYLGTLPVRLRPVRVDGQDALLALSSQSWLCFVRRHVFRTVPLAYEKLEFASCFSSQQCEEGVVSIVKNTLKIFTVEHLDEMFNEKILPLEHTPRDLITLPSGNMVIIETDHNAFTLSEKKALVDSGHDYTPLKPTEEDVDEDDEEGEQETPDEATRRIGLVKPSTAGKWASILRVVNPNGADMGLENLQMLELTDNEAAFTIAHVQFRTRPGEDFVVVGTACNLKFHPKSTTCGYLHLYQVNADGETLRFIHKTSVHDVPCTVAAFEGQLLVAVGNALRLYDVGKRKLLRKCENKNFGSPINSIKVFNDRIWVSTQQDSIHCVKYNRSQNALVLFCDDIAPRHTTCMEVLDHSKCIGGDKFGNIFALRLPTLGDDIDNPTGNRLLWDTGCLNGAPYKFETLINYNVGSCITSIQKTTLALGGREVILYSTIEGTIGALVPVKSLEDMDFFSQLEMHIRNTDHSLVGREHTSFRSAYYPVKGVIDGDLCDFFNTLDKEKQDTIGEDLSRKPGEILKKLEDFRNEVL
eukprot:TRINITY_DN9195_c0_g1_i1.p1 TRINITY_DN9195_c0_g1~~TRINITY_DN9195_c0_g1_i1.p1  ORF type:complete len:1219 (-),score=407.38 TRINITY_DN9195_c0_g1_i1:149-3805(-)